MEIKQISDKDLVGKVFINIQSFDINEYFEAIEKLRSLVNKVDEHLTGFYINRISLPYDDPNPKYMTVRITYFTSQKNKDDTRNNIIKFLKNNNLKLVPKSEGYEQEPQNETISQSYDKDEPRLRNFFFTSTLIGIDLIENNFRFSRLILKGYDPIRSNKGILEPIFIQYSKTYLDLSPDEEKQVWGDFEFQVYIEKQKIRTYSHMFENMMCYTHLI